METVCKITGLAGVAVVVFAVGCGGEPTATVTGKVTIDGRPVANLEVSFNPKEAGTGTTALGFTDADGNYKLSYPGGKTKIPVGEYTVSIVPAETDEAQSRPPVIIPPCYNTATKLTASVKPGANTIDFPLKSSGE